MGQPTFHLNAIRLRFSNMWGCEDMDGIYGENEPAMVKTEYSSANTEL